MKNKFVVINIDSLGFSMLTTLMLNNENNYEIVTCGQTKMGDVSQIGENRIRGTANFAVFKAVKEDPEPFIYI